MSSSSPLAPVVVVVDRGGSAAAVRYGAAEALRTGRPLRLVHVTPAGDPWLERVARDSLRVALARADAEVVGRVPVLATSLGGGLTQLAHVADTAVLMVLEQLRAEVHRRPPESAAALAAATDTSVVVVPEEWVERHRGVVSVGLDPDATDDTALRTAMALARLRNCALRVVVCGRATRADISARLEQLGGDGCDLAVELADGPPEEALVRAGATSDLLVLGRHQPGLPGGSRLGSLGRELLDSLACPLLMTVPGHVHCRTKVPAEGTVAPAPS